MRYLGLFVAAALVLLSALVCSYGDNLVEQPVISQPQTIGAIVIAVIGGGIGLAIFFGSEE